MTELREGLADVVGRFLATGPAIGHWAESLSRAILEDGHSWALAASRTEAASIRAELDRIYEIRDQERQFVYAAKQWCRLRQELSDFREPTAHVMEWTNLVHRHSLAEKAMREAWRNLPEGGVP